MLSFVTPLIIILNTLGDIIKEPDFYIIDTKVMNRTLRRNSSSKITGALVLGVDNTNPVVAKDERPTMRKSLSFKYRPPSPIGTVR